MIVEEKRSTNTYGTAKPAYGVSVGNRARDGGSPHFPLIVNRYHAGDGPVSSLFTMTWRQQDWLFK